MVTAAIMSWRFLWPFFKSFYNHGDNYCATIFLLNSNFSNYSRCCLNITTWICDRYAYLNFMCTQWNLIHFGIYICYTGQCDGPTEGYKLWSNAGDTLEGCAAACNCTHNCQYFTWTALSGSGDPVYPPDIDTSIGACTMRTGGMYRRKYLRIHNRFA